MAITFSNALSGMTTSTGVASLTASFTSGSGSNRILFVFAMTTNYTAQADAVTGITYAGVSMIRINTTVLAAANSRGYLYYLIAPATGANNIIVSTTGNGGSSTISVTASSYSGASQTGVPDAQATNNAGAATTLTTSVTTIANNSWLVSGMREDSAATPTAGTGTTFRPSAGSLCMADSNGGITPAGSGSLIVNFSPSGNIMMCMASFSPAIIPITANGAFLFNLL